MYTPEQCKQIFSWIAVCLGDCVLASFMNAPWQAVPAMLHPYMSYIPLLPPDRQQGYPRVLA
jgi:hypothetical protein